MVLGKDRADSLDRSCEK